MAKRRRLSCRETAASPYTKYGKRPHRYSFSDTIQKAKEKGIRTEGLTIEQIKRLLSMRADSDSVQREANALRKANNSKRKVRV
jgi:DNA-binding transcriptional MerR regulator